MSFLRGMMARSASKPGDQDDAAWPDPTTTPQADPDDAVPKAAPPQSEPINIWDFAEDEEDGGEIGTDLSQDSGIPAELTDNELARRALEMLQARAPDEAAEPPAHGAAPQPAPTGRAKTRLLGFSARDDAEPDIFGGSAPAGTSQPDRFPVGWLVVSDGPGRGASFTLFSGVSQIGRAEDQAVALSFGDTAISRANHAAIAFDPEQNAFFLGHGGKANIVRLNGQPVLSTEPLGDGDLIRIGETTLLFVALCGEDFGWDSPADTEASRA